MSYKPSDDYYALFATSSFSTGNSTDADIAPYGYAFQNSVYDVSFGLNITNIETGLYKASGTIPVGYNDGDSIDIQISATVDSITGKSIIDHFVIDSKRVNELNDLSTSDTIDSVTTTASVSNAVATDSASRTASKADISGLSTSLALSTHDSKLDTAQDDLDIITGVDGSTLATSQPNYAPSKVGDNMNLANDAITASKFDESTAFPTKSADVGSTAIARVGADGDTLETISDQIDSTATSSALTTHDNKIGTPANIDSGGATISDNLKKLADDNSGADFDSTLDSLKAIRDRGDSEWTTGASGSDRLLMVDTTIATLATQISFTLTAGSSDNNAYNNCTIVIEDVSTATQKAVGMVLNYTGSSKTITLKESLPFIIATTDKVYILAENSLKSTVSNRQLDVTAAGGAGIDWSNIENPTTAVDLSGTDIQLADTTTTVSNDVTTDSASRTASKADVSGLATTSALSTHDGKLDTAQNDLDLLTGVDGATLATAQGNYAPSKVGDNMNLVDDAISSAKFDESSAFPLVSSDAGATQIARVGADGDTLETLSDQIDSVEAKTTNLPASPAAVGSEMTLENDAITASKFDESTAFPLKSSDSGNTLVARTGADGDTLETISDQVDLTSTASALSTHDGKLDTAQNDLDLLTGVDGATLATSQPNFTPSVAGDEMNLADDAITASKFDESTSFPTKSVDSGATQLARTGADGDTLETLSDQVDSVEAKTTNLPASPSAVGSEMTLEDDAITAAKHDESTSFPLKNVDSGSTELARTGADGDTLEDLSDQIDLTSTHSAADVVDAMFAATPTAGGITTFGEMSNVIYSMARGKIVRTNNVYDFYDDADVAVLFSVTVSAGARTPS